MYQSPSTAVVTGDPHVKTLDGRSYTVCLLPSKVFTCGSPVTTSPQPRDIFVVASFRHGGRVAVSWGRSQENPGGLAPLAHYSGHLSFTKGLLLVDMSGESLQQVLEITAQKCEWRARKANQGWTAVKSSEPSDLISVDAEGNDVTTFNLVTTNGAKFHNRLHMNVHTKETGIAVLRLSCRPNHNLEVVVRPAAQSDQPPYHHVAKARVVTPVQVSGV